MFKNKNNLCQISSFLLLVLICCNQVYQFSHLHHFHEDDSLVVEVSYHPVDVDVLHSSAHVHGEEKSSHSSEHQHRYENNVDWSITRSQVTNDSTFDILDLAFSAF
jgi:ABC-type nickel/cobalt efflux system permease component RcnA